MTFNIFSNFLKRRHFWRYATFSEIAELYVSRTLRVVAIYIASGFTSVYLYELGYSLSFIMICWACLYLLKSFSVFFVAFFVAEVGPKHGTLISNLLYIPAMISIGLVPNVGFAGFLLGGVFLAISSSIYHLCYLVDFSKVKDVDHAGKEIAFMNIFEKIAMGISPVVGGLIALWFTPQIVMFVAALFFLFAAWPLLKTSEPVRINQKIRFKDFPWKTVSGGLVAQFGIGFDTVTTGIAWGLFITIAILSNAGNAIYVDLGIFSSVTILVAILTSYAYGKMIDKNQGGNLLKFSVIANSLVHIFRAFASSVASIFGVNITNEIATTGQSMSFMRGLFDTADLSGHRIVYLCISDVILYIGAVMACLTTAICATLLGDINGLKVTFLITAVVVLIINVSNFKLYHK